MSIRHTDPHMYNTWEEAKAALTMAEADVEADMGEDALEEGWYDLVMNIAGRCSPEVAERLINTEL
jgi:hypothetical protein